MIFLLEAIKRKGVNQEKWRVNSKKRGMNKNSLILISKFTIENR